MASFQLANHPSFSSGVSLGPCGSRLLRCPPPPGPHCPARPCPHPAPPQPHTPHASCPGPPVSLPGGLPQCFCSWLALPPPPGSLPGSRSAHPPQAPGEPCHHGLVLQQHPELEAQSRKRHSQPRGGPGWGSLDSPGTRLGQRPFPDLKPRRGWAATRLGPWRRDRTRTHVCGRRGGGWAPL